MLDIAGEAKPRSLHLSRHHLVADFVPVTLEHIKNCLDLFLHHLQCAPTSMQRTCFNVRTPKLLNHKICNLSI